MDYISHHGIKGMKWGVRRYQNKDGSLTAKGKKRYGLGDNGELVKKSGETRLYERLASSGYKNAKTQKMLYEQFGDDYNRRSSEQWVKEADQNSKQARRSFELDKMAVTDKRLANQLRSGKIGEKSARVVTDFRFNTLDDKKFMQKWEAAHKNGQDSNEWAELVNYTNDLWSKHRDQFAKAWLEDNHIQTLSDAGERYVDTYIKSMYDNGRSVSKRFG